MLQIKTVKLKTFVKANGKLKTGEMRTSFFLCLPVEFFTYILIQSFCTQSLDKLPAMLVGIYLKFCLPTPISLP